MHTFLKETDASIENEMRILAGGSSGGSGSGSGSGGSGGGFGGGNSGGPGGGGVCATCEEPEGMVGLGTGAIVAIVSVVVTVLLLLIVCMMRGTRVERKRFRKRPVKRAKLTPFEKKLKELRDSNKEDKDDNSVNEADLSATTPTSGFYDVDFEVKGNVIGGQVKFEFTDIGGRYKITGSSGDEEEGSTTQIDEGYVSYNGSNAWWLDSGNAGMKILCSGTFNFNASTFSGVWQASNGMSGRFTRFVLSTETYVAALNGSSNRSIPLFDQLENTIAYDLGKTDA